MPQQVAGAAEDDLDVVAAGLGKFCEGLAAARGNEQVKQDFAVAGFEDAAVLFQQKGQRIRSQIAEIWKDTLAKVTATREEIMALVKGMPACANEEVYRTKGITKVHLFADKVKILESLLAAVKLQEGRAKLVSQLDFGSGQLGPLAEGESASSGSAFDPEACAKCISIASCHVALVAALCLLRSSSLGAASQAGKQVSKQLGPVSTTLEEKLKALPEDEGALRAFAQTIREECTAAASQAGPQAKKPKTAAAEAGEDAEAAMSHKTKDKKKAAAKAEKAAEKKKPKAKAKK